MRRNEVEQTTYSECVEGTSDNHDLTVRFDMTDGFVGITQFDGDVVRDRVLLSPEQWKHLVAFVRVTGAADDRR